MSRPGLREVIRRTRTNGIADSGRRVVRRLYRVLDSRMDLSSVDFPLDDRDIASSSAMRNRTAPAPGWHDVLNIGWLCTPPQAGSGGHTTFFRMVRGLEERGHRCTILLYDRHGGDLERHRAAIRRGWPELNAKIETVPVSLEGFDACVASSWETAHVLASRAPAGSGLAAYYFIQDYEPYFYPRGSLYSLAEESYRFGFTNLALGEMVASTLRRELGLDSECITYGSDLSSYSMRNKGTRAGVVFFARPGVDRRGYEMGRLALLEFHRRHPDHEIHIYGSKVRGWGIPLIQHGVLGAEELNDLYNRTCAGLALSFTNITLVAAEMLAAGNIPVVNDHEFARPMLRNPEVVWSQPTPTLLADALSSVVTDPERSARSTRAAAYTAPDWAVAQSEVSRLLTGKAAWTV